MILLFAVRIAYPSVCISKLAQTMFLRYLFLSFSFSGVKPCFFNKCFLLLDSCEQKQGKGFMWWRKEIFIENENNKSQWIKIRWNLEREKWKKCFNEFSFHMTTIYPSQLHLRDSKANNKYNCFTINSNS